MELKITDKKKNNVMNRTELVVEMHEKTIPSKQQIRDKLAALISTDSNKIAITKVLTKFGSSKAKIYANAYDTNEALKKTESKYVVVRNFGEEKKAGEEEADANAPAAFKK